MAPYVAEIGKARFGGENSTLSPRYEEIGFELSIFKF
jgi:hypothetical protein